MSKKRKKVKRQKPAPTPSDAPEDSGGELPDADAKSAESNRGDGLWTVVCIVVLSVAVGFGYASLFLGGFEFLFDDFPCIVNNPTIGEYDSIWNFTQQDVPRGLQRRPLPSWTLTANFQSAGLNVHAYQVTNVVIHWVATLLLFALFCRLLKLPTVDPNVQGNAVLIAFVATSIWAVHPIQTESVTYVIQRIESLMGLFYIATVLFLVVGIGSRLRLVWFGLSLIACFLGMISKEVMITAPVMAILFDWVLFRGSVAERIKSRGWLYVGYLACGLILIASTVSPNLFQSKLEQPKMEKPVTAFSVTTFKLERAGLGPVQRSQTTTDRFSGSQSARSENLGSTKLPTQGEVPVFRTREKLNRWSYLTTQASVILQYIKLSLWPSQLCFDRNWPIASGLGDFLVPGLILLVGLGISLFWLVRRKPLGLVLFSFFLLLAPTSSLMPIGTVYFEHRMYLPLASLTMLVALGIHWLCRGLPGSTQKPAIFALGVALSIALVISTVGRNETYRTSEMLYQDTLQKDPNSWRAMEHLGTLYCQRGQYREAVGFLNRALEIETGWAPTHLNYALALSRSGQAAKALRHLNTIESGFKNEKRKGEFYYHRAMAFENLGQWSQAERDYELAVTTDPMLVQCWVDYAAARSGRGELSLAAEYLKTALEIDPRHVEANINAGVMVMMQRGNPQTALAHFRKALERDPDNQTAQDFLERTLDEIGQPGR